MSQSNPEELTVSSTIESNSDILNGKLKVSKKVEDECPDRNSVSWIWPLVVLGVGITIFYLINLNDLMLPTPVTKIEAEENPTLFSGERSRTTLRKLTALGPRVVGDRANEVDAPNIILDEIREVLMTAHTAQNITYERQKGSGAFTLNAEYNYTSIYDNIQNIIVKIDGSDGKHSVLVNCHFDSVYEADGASDDAINCAIMLELLRVLSKSPIRLQHNVVLLFNGAEEVGLQGSYLFTKHKWSDDCEVILNLEGAGIGGKETLFQMSLKNSWLIKYYAKYAPHPHGQIFGEEMFQSGIIPSDTDFRIFRDYGKMSGMDFAFYRTGHVYHTRFDTEAYIPLGSHQNMGDNILALLMALGNAEELNHMEVDSEGQMVYYDYLGWFMISYSAEGGIAMNIITVIFAVCSIVIFIGRLLHTSWLPFSTYSPEDNDYTVFRRKYIGESDKESLHNMTSIREILLELAIVIGTRIISFGAAVGVTVIVGLIINASASLSMPWYSNAWLIFPLYWIPFLVVFSVIPYFMDKWRMEKHGLSLSLTAQMNMIGCEIIWIFALFVMTCMGIRSASIFFVPVLFFTISNLVIFLTPLYLTAHEWVWTHLLIHLPAFLLSSYLGLIIYIVFIPVMGRSGVVNSDLSMAIVTCFSAFLISSLIVPLMTLVRKPIIVLGSLTLFSVLMIIVSMSTSIVHPYQVGPCDPKVQRYWIMHTFREYRDENQDIRLSESGYFVLNQDPNSPKTIPPESRINIRSLREDCEKELFCGLPLYRARMVPLSPESSWIPAGMPTQPNPIELSLVDGKKCNETTMQCELTFSFKGPDRMTVTFSPRPGATLVDWSLPTDIKASNEWKGRPSYFLHIVRGEFSSPYQITFTFEITSEVINAPILDIGLAGNHVHHVKDRTSEFKNFLNTFPDWTHNIGFISAFKSFVF